MAAKRWLVLGVVLVCTLLSLSCVTPCCAGLDGRSSLGLAPSPMPTVPTSDEAASRLEEKARALGNDSFQIEFTDEEITSFLALRMPDSSPFASPQVHLQPGEVLIEGDLTSPIPGHLTLSGTLQVVDGKPLFQFEEVSVAGFTLPGAALDPFSDSIEQMITEGQASVELTSIEILAGRMIITGHSRTP